MQTDATLERLGRKHGRTAAQVALRFQIQRGLAVVPKSNDRERQLQNISVGSGHIYIEDASLRFPCSFWVLLSQSTEVYLTTGQYEIRKNGSEGTQEAARQTVGWCLHFGNQSGGRRQIAHRFLNLPHSDLLTIVRQCKKEPRMQVQRRHEACKALMTHAKVENDFPCLIRPHRATLLFCGENYHNLKTIMSPLRGRSCKII